MVVLLMEENLRHLGCIKSVVNNGILNFDLRVRPWWEKVLPTYVLIKWWLFMNRKVERIKHHENKIQTNHFLDPSKTHPRFPILPTYPLKLTANTPENRVESQKETSSEPTNDFQSKMLVAGRVPSIFYHFQVDLCCHAEDGLLWKDVMHQWYQWPKDGQPRWNHPLELKIFVNMHILR